MDRDTDTGPLPGDQEEKLPGTRRSAYRSSDHYSLGSETRHERSWRNDGVSRGVFGGQSHRNNLTRSRSSNHTAAPTGSWRNVSREASGGARPKESNTSWRRNNWDKEGGSQTQIDRRETSNPRRRADSQGEGSAAQPSRDTDSKTSRDFFRRPGILRNNCESTTSIPTGPPIPGKETKWRRGQSDFRSDLGKYTGQVQVKQNPKTPPISEAELKTLVTASPLEVLHKLLSKKDEWLALLNQDSFNDNVMVLILSVLSCICELDEHSKVKQDVHMVFSMVESEGFLSKHLTRHLVGLSTQQPHDQDSGNKNTLTNNVPNILKLLQVFLVHKPESYGDVGVVLILLEKVVSLLAESDGADLDPKGHNYMIQVQQLKECYHSLNESHQMKQKIKAQQPPNNFRDIPIIPDSSEIRKPTKPFLRKNIIKGRYQDVEHYLDVQYRLLREDFVAPLREGIIEFISEADSRHQDIRVYHGVSIQSQRIEKGVCLYTLEFDVKVLKRIKWEKRLLYGSLVCLTKDKFKHIVCASVANRKVSDLEKGQVDVCFRTETSNTPTGTFVMVESVAYFEAYRHVLLGLQRMKGDSFPFERYIVNVLSNVKTPKYLSGDNSDVYDLRPLVVGTVKKLEGGGMVETFKNAAYVPILDPQSWPAAEALHLDESQKAAVQAALTKEFAIIQGPPGTGKTYIGLKIIELLLYNIHTSPDASPILVVCYTNHALDQFLEGVLNFGEESLVRVGSRGNSEALQEKKLSYLKKQRGNCEEQKWLEKETAETLRFQAKSNIRYTLSDIACAKMVVLKVETLNKFMTDTHRHGFQKNIKRQREPTTNLLNWLNVVDIEHESDSSDMSDSNEEKDEVIGVDDESVRLQHERRIDDEDDSSSSDDEQEQHAQFGLRPIAAYSIECKKRCGLNSESTPQEELRKADTITDKEASGIRNVWSLTFNDRWRLYRLWVKRYIEEQEELLTNYRRSNDSLSEEIEAINASKDLEILSKARVIGMTTTSAARLQFMLQLLGPRIVIVEEAAEVLEAHTITALTAKCEHLILIGDHQQLKPNPTVYRLAKVFNLDTSLFERMINNGVPFQTLTQQHRMRPEISKLMKKHFYENLHDDESVMGFDDVKGVAHNMFFIDHNQFEDGSGDDNKTKSNQHEAEFLVELCRYLLHQGYKPTQITILTTYVGQLFTFKELMDKKPLESVRVSVVDNFQGEENDIILLSLVRSNERGSIGFLKTSNRVCVAMSRARMGFYCIGNASILRKSSIWSGIISTLEDEKKIGSSLSLVCQNHAVVTTVASARDFKEKVQDGGCGEPCGHRFLCDHICQLNCHPFDLNHDRCTEPCSELCGRDEHACPLKCYEDCRPCLINVPKLMPECGHVIQVECHQYESITCTEPCPKPLPCGHPCGRACGDENLDLIPCTHLCDKLLECGHQCPNKCSEPCPKERMDAARIYRNFDKFCREKCERSLPCGHPCPNKCGEPCPKERVHAAKMEQHARIYSNFKQFCKEKCERSLPCGHPCGKACGDICTTNCTVKVSKHVRKCGHDVVVECVENPDLIPCTHLCDKLLICGHRCPQKCSEPCPQERVDEANMNWYGDFDRFCKDKCERSLSCGHPCPNKCGEPCPKDTVKDTDFSIRYLSTKCETITEKTLPKCGHILAVPCHTDMASLSCTKTCNKQLSCGHRCTCKCGVPCKCKLRVNRKLPSCGHFARLPCYQDLYSYQCVQKCQKTLPCGHPCSNKCCEPCQTDGADAPSESPRNSPAKACQRSVRKKFASCHHSVVLPCYKDVESVVCSEKCTRVLSCGHNCPNRCVEPCPSSNLTDVGDAPLESSRNSPAKVCPLSVRKKFPGCQHSVVLPCYIDVESITCSKKCTKVLLCGHKCPNRCGKPCPRSNPTFEETYSDWSDDSNSSSEQEFLYVSKCKQYVNKKIPSCGHVIESQCHKRVESLVCPMPCEKILSCGHQCANDCGESCQSEEYISSDDEEGMNGNDFVKQKCQVFVNKQLPDCRHFMNLPCYKKEGSAECSNPCEKILQCGHKCPNVCGETCLNSERCDELVEKTLPGCGHAVETQCCKNVKLITCTEICEKVLPCGHVCPNDCKDPCPRNSLTVKTETWLSAFHSKPKVLCEETVENDLPCGHVIKVLCWKASDYTTITSCGEPCGHVLRCGHKCPGSCGSCEGLGGEHKVCNNECGTLLLCGHRCSEKCSHDVCSPHKYCNWLPKESTEHSICQHKGIMDKTQTTSCTFPCIQKLLCSHFCIGVCGEPCPPVCRICHKKDVADKYPPGPIRPKETFIYLEDCEHLCETRFLDEMFASFQTSETGCVQIRPALCPKCQTPIRKCPRYEDILHTIKESVDSAKEKCKEKVRNARLSFAVGGWMRCPKGHVFCGDDASNDLEGCLLCPVCTTTHHSDYSSNGMDM